MKDRFNREIDYLRLSVTDKCNLRCIYCMEDTKQQFLKNSHLMTDEEIIKIITASAKLGIKKIRLTGGEPLARPGITELIAQINQIEGIEGIYLTTNGTLLANQVHFFAKNGLKAVNISLDSLTLFLHFYLLTSVLVQKHAYHTSLRISNCTSLQSIKQLS